MVERMELRDVVAMEMQFSVTPAIRGTLLPFSKARRRALFQDQHRITHPQTQYVKTGSSRITKTQSTGIEVDSVSDLLIQNRLEIA
jgi:hypothetical protein